MLQQKKAYFRNFAAVIASHCLKRLYLKMQGQMLMSMETQTLNC